jgi:hypothetical protein
MKKRRFNILGLVALTAVVYLFNFLACSGGGNTNQGPATISISPQVTSVAVNSTTTFTANTTNAAGQTPFWDIVETQAAGGDGTFNPSSGSGSTMAYTAPSTPPVYAFESGNTDGMIQLQAEIENTAACEEATASVTFTVTAPTVTVGLIPQTTSVALGSTALLTGYAVGSTNLGVTVQVNGVTGGSTSAGTIGPNTYPNTFVYTAPTSMPMTGSTVTITLISSADLTKTATTTLTLH